MPELAAYIYCIGTMSSFILGRWQETEARLANSIKNYNSHDLASMEIALEDAKKALRDFIEVLKEES